MIRKNRGDPRAAVRVSEYCIFWKCDFEMNGDFQGFLI